MRRYRYFKVVDFMKVRGYKTPFRLDVDAKDPNIAVVLSMPNTFKELSKQEYQMELLKS